MNRLALGTVQFGMPYGIANKTGQVTRTVARSMLQLAAVNGIDTLDTAIAYGESETCLGEVGTQDFRLITKLPAVPNDCVDVSEWVQQQVNDALARLGVISVYGLLLHNSLQLQKKYGGVLYQALQNLKASGQVQKIGISIYSPNELNTLLPHYKFDLIQAPFNLFDQRLASSGWLQRLNSMGVEIHTRSVFLQGLLLIPAEKIPAKFSPWADFFNRWHQWLSNNSVSAVQGCLAFPLSFSEIDHVVVGSDSVKQLEQIINFSKTRLPCMLPDLSCDDENLINPVFWSQL